MKKIVFLLLVTLLLCMVIGAHALENVTFLLPKNVDGGDDTIISIVVLDKAYMLSVSGCIYEFDPDTGGTTALSIYNADPQYEEIPSYILKENNIKEEADITEYLKKEARGIDILFLDGETIYGINELNGALYRVEITQDAATLHGICRLDFHVPECEESFANIDSGAISGDSLYLMMWLEADDDEYKPYRFDMHSGVREPFEAQEKIRYIERYSPEHLLMYEEAGEEGYDWKITDYDCATGSFTPLYQSSHFNLQSIDLSELLYDSWRDRILMQSGDRIIAFTSETSYEVVDYQQMYPHCRAMLSDGRMVAINKAIYLRSVLEEKAETKPLIVACENLDISMEDYLKVNPDAVVQHHWGYSTNASQFATAMNLQSSDIDIFELPIGSVTQRALEKGYYYPLNESTAICEQSVEYRPFFAQVVMNGEDIAAIPKTATHRTFAYSKYAMEQLGLTASDMPTTFEGLLDFLLDWDERVGTAANIAEITPFGIANSNMKTELFAQLLDQYFILMQEDFSRIPDYEVDLARLLDKLSLVMDIIPSGSGGGPYISDGVLFSKYKVNNHPSYLFTLEGSFHPARRSFSDNEESVSDFVPVVLSLPSRDRPLLFFEGTVFIVNPYTTQKEAALDFLAYYSRNNSSGNEAVFLQNATPIEWFRYKTLKRHYELAVTNLQTRIAKAQGVEKLELEQQLPLKQEELELVELLKWQVDEQAIADCQWAFENSDGVWNDPTVYASSFNYSYRSYIADGLDGLIVAKDFFTAYGMVLMEAK